MAWNYSFISKLQPLHHWSLRMDKYFHPILYNGCNHLYMLGLKLIHFSKGAPDIFHFHMSFLHAFSMQCKGFEYIYICHIDIWYENTFYVTKFDSCEASSSNVNFGNADDYRLNWRVINDRKYTSGGASYHNETRDLSYWQKRAIPA